MKKLLCLFLIAICVCSLFGCNNKKSNLKLEDFVDFVLEVEAGRDVKILQLSDIQIIDSSQRREPGRLPSWSVSNWATEN